jgi:hypothetical protein
MSITTMFWSDAQSHDMTRPISLNHTDHKSDHLFTGADDFMTNRLCVREKVPDRFTIVRLAIREAPLVESPAFVKISVAHRHYDGLSRSHHSLN